ncbi:hypothetical protein [Fimbriimonas ginsengisoli]|uniref:Uncharacterized protein n=1 Tax=Fimbriimonas ginsengisoli Gsoil 348 TaxID=661478 RepID=A0A068NT21_FIMGI|nr:hypothetical protein [Fimbriimonas ginsengisoli]AIE86497.1 hypothetical protein OP10G_3129 [Fimbriimonas ginsengisoli Gsoil 348]
MPYVLTVNSTVQCAHGAKIALTSDAKLSVGGAKVLLLAGIQGATVNGCTNPTDPNTSSLTCATVATATGTATKLTVGGKPVVLDSLSGTTNGTPPPSGASISVADVGHQKLKAV